MPHAKIIMYLVATLIFCACQQTAKNKHLIREKVDNVATDERDSSTVDNYEVSIPNLVVKIDHEQARKLNVSTSVIGTKVKEIVENNENELSIEELLNQRLTFRNIRGKIVTIPMRSVIDTVYFE